MLRLEKSNNILQNLFNILTISPALFHLLPPEKFIEPAKELIKSAFSLDKRVVIFGEENIPEEGPVYFICEHRHILDPVFLVVSVLDRTGILVHYVMRDDFLGRIINPYAKKYLNTVLIKRGDEDLIAQEEAVQILKNKGYLAFCPSGTRSKNGSFDDIYLSAREKESLEKKIKAERIKDDTDLFEYKIKKMANRAHSFIKDFDNMLKIVPVGITFNEVNKNIYLSFGQPIEYDKKDKRKEQISRVRMAVEELPRLKVIAHQILSYFFYELNRQDEAIKKYFGVDDGILVRKIHYGLNKVLEELSNKHSFFDLDFYNGNGKVGISWEVLGNYIENFVERDILIMKSRDPDRYILNPEKVKYIEISKKFKDSAPILSDFNEIKHTHEIEAICNNSFIYVRDRMENETNLF